MGVSILLVAVLSVALPPLFGLAFWLLRKARQRCLTRCVQAASQEAYNGAWIGDEFLLDYRRGACGRVWAWVASACLGRRGARGGLTRAGAYLHLRAAVSAAQQHGTRTRPLTRL